MSFLTDNNKEFHSLVDYLSEYAWVGGRFDFHSSLFSYVLGCIG